MFGVGSEASSLFVVDGSNVQACQTACTTVGTDCAGWSASKSGRGKDARTQCNLFGSIASSTEGKRMKTFRSCTASELVAFQSRPEDEKDEKKMSKEEAEKLVDNLIEKEEKRGKKGKKTDEEKQAEKEQKEQEKLEREERKQAEKEAK